MTLASQQSFMSSQSMSNGLNIIDRSITQIPNAANIEELGMYAFAGCLNLTTGYFPNCKTIHVGAFMCCQSIVELNMPALTSIDTTQYQDMLNKVWVGNSTWQNCGIADGSGIQIVRMPALTATVYNTFHDTTKLKTVYLDSCISLQDITFCRCISLIDVYVPCVQNFYGRTFGYLTDLMQDVTFHCTSMLASSCISQISANSYRAFSPTDQSAWHLIHFECKDGNVDWNGSEWITT